ncbi:MAG: multiheme c-type cytochrome [Candidatus Adiutricales bacterium]
MNKIRLRRTRIFLLVFFSALVLFLLLSLGTSLATEAKYVGVKKCKTCHKPQYKIWLTLSHAKALSVLSADEQKNPECLGCHTTGYGKPASSTAKLENVQCEACHGPGSLYKSAKIMSKSKYKKDPEASRAKSIAAGLILPTEEACVKCHNDKSPSFKGFDFKAAFEKIKH